MLCFWISVIILHNQNKNDSVLHSFDITNRGFMPFTLILYYSYAPAGKVDLFDIDLPLSQYRWRIRLVSSGTHKHGTYVLVKAIKTIWFTVNCWPYKGVDFVRNFVQHIRDMSWLHFCKRYAGLFPWCANWTFPLLFTWNISTSVWYITCIHNHIHIKMWGVITHLYPNFSAGFVELWLMLERRWLNTCHVNRFM